MAHPFQSESVGAIFTALAKAQAAIQNPTKNATNPHFKSTYASLPQILSEVKPILNDVGLVLTQPIKIGRAHV